MRKTLTLLLMTALCAYQLSAQSTTANTTQNDSYMSEAYWKLWNPEVQAKIDSDIEKNRKADAVCQLTGIPKGTEIKIEQISHDFIFGAHIFNFNQLGKKEYNDKYKELYGTLFNSATIGFYWKKFEMQPNRLRFKEEYWDTEAYWNSVENPKEQPNWRRPATDPVVEFCESKGIRLHGHPMVWGIRSWQHPEWIYDQFCPADEKEKLSKIGEEDKKKMTSAEIEAIAPVYTRELNRIFKKRVTDLANYYGNRIKSWDVVNESSSDYHGNCVTGDAICNSKAYGLMPGDYTYHGFKTAQSLLSKDVMLNINDYSNNENYVNQVKDLLAHGCRIDILGSQMHLFDPKQCLDIAEGKLIESPKQVWAKMDLLAKAGLPIHLSEITITSPGSDAKGYGIQAVITRNLYRLWFSIKPMMGITWWNVVDDCGAPGEPSVSGLFTRDMQPKPSFYVLDHLINHEWKTNMTVKIGSKGDLRFRGFKGRYLISWKDASGILQQKEFYLKNDGDGFKL